MAPDSCSHISRNPKAYEMRMNTGLIVSPDSALSNFPQNRRALHCTLTTRAAQCTILPDVYQSATS